MAQPVHTLEHEGKIYATLDDHDPHDNGQSGESQSDFRRVPPGWQFAPDTAETVEVIKKAAWGANYIITADEHRYYSARTGQPGKSVDKVDNLQIQGDAYAPTCANGRILIQKKSDAPVLLATLEDKVKGLEEQGGTLYSDVMALKSNFKGIVALQEQVASLAQSFSEMQKKMEEFDASKQSISEIKKKMEDFEASKKRGAEIVAAGGGASAAVRSAQTEVEATSKAAEEQQKIMDDLRATVAKGVSIDMSGHEKDIEIAVAKLEASKALLDQERAMDVEATTDLSFFTQRVDSLAAKVEGMSGSTQEGREATTDLSSFTQRVDSLAAKVEGMSGSTQEGREALTLVKKLMEEFSKRPEAEQRGQGHHQDVDSKGGGEDVEAHHEHKKVGDEDDA